MLESRTAIWKDLEKPEKLADMTQNRKTPSIHEGQKPPQADSNLFEMDVSVLLDRSKPLLQRMPSTYCTTLV